MIKPTIAKGDEEVWCTTGQFDLDKKTEHHAAGGLYRWKYSNTFIYYL